MTSITIEGEDYPIKFGYGAFRHLGVLWEQEGIQGVIKVFEKTFSNISADPKFDALEKIGDLVNAGVINAGGESLNTDDILNDLVFQDSGKLQTVVDAFMKSIPGAENGKKKVSQKKAPKPKPKAKK